MTLMELLVTVSILVMIASAMVWMLISAKITFQSSAARSAQRQELQRISRDLVQELGNSSITLLTVTSGGAIPAFGFLSAYDRNGNFVTDATGAPRWQKYTIYYIPAGTSRLLCKEVYGTFTQMMTQEQLLSYCTGDGRLLTKSAASMSLAPDTAAGKAIFSLTMRSTSSHGKTDQQSVTMTIHTND